MDDRTLKEMELDDLWALHQSVSSILASRLETKKHELEDRLSRLNAKPDLVKEPPRRPYPPVPPKFRNPAEPHQTWSGRGKRPHWVLQEEAFRIFKSTKRHHRRLISTSNKSGPSID